MTQLIDGRYEVIQSLSAGGFGITFLAKDLRRPGQPRCVVKQLRPQRDFDANTWQVARRLFDQEAEILQRLGRHDQIPLLLAHLEENGNFYIVQDFLEGHTFRDELLATRRLPEKKVITLLRQGLTVLSYVHQQGVIHRDIKPENLIRRQDGVLCLIDFGIVKEFSAQHLSRMASPQAGLASTTVSIGTEGYTPLEQIRGKPCPASDVYSLGMVALEAITGKCPRDLPDDPTTMEVVWQPGTPVSPALAKVLTNMVRFNYGRRYANGKEALQALEAALAPPVPTVVVSPKAPESQPQPQPKKQGWLQGLFGQGLFDLSGAPQPAPQPQPQRQPSAQRPQPAAQDDLSSEKGIDYTRLRDLLKAGKWRDADKETYEVMIRAVGKKSGDWFTTNELLKFPCTDLRTIDGLWVKYSQGKFGFSVQKKIYVECSAKLDGKYPGDKIWHEFCHRVGWRKGDSYLNYKDLKANPSFSHAGEFPVGWRVGGFVSRGSWGEFPVGAGGGLWSAEGAWSLSSLAQRLVNCSSP